MRRSIGPCRRSRCAEPQIGTSPPTIYRIHEVTQGYGTTIKALINGEFGDAIMSAITFNMDIEREETDARPRVKVTYNGKLFSRSWE